MRINHSMFGLNKDNACFRVEKYWQQIEFVRYHFCDCTKIILKYYTFSFLKPEFYHCFMNPIERKSNKAN